jgi:hypothetical protein
MGMERMSARKKSVPRPGHGRILIMPSNRQGSRGAVRRDVTCAGTGSRTHSGVGTAGASSVPTTGCLRPMRAEERPSGRERPRLLPRLHAAEEQAREGEPGRRTEREVRPGKERGVGRIVRGTGPETGGRTRRCETDRCGGSDRRRDTRAALRPPVRPRLRRDSGRERYFSSSGRHSRSGGPPGSYPVASRTASQSKSVRLARVRGK